MGENFFYLHFLRELYYTRGVVIEYLWRGLGKFKAFFSFSFSIIGNELFRCGFCFEIFVVFCFLSMMSIVLV